LTINQQRRGGQEDGEAIHKIIKLIE
jgi:hypothetical protein